MDAEDQVVLSMGPEELSRAAGSDWSIELKLDWEDMEPGGYFHEEAGLDELLENSGVDPDRVVDIHLPPGTSDSNPGMSAVEENVGAMAGFSYDHLEDRDDIFLTTHPPKQFRYLDQLWVLKDLLERVPNEVSIENTSDPSKWYTPEAVAFFGFVGSQYPESFEDLYLTVDSAHLPQGDYVQQDFDDYYKPEDEEVAALMDRSETGREWLFEIDYDQVEDIVHEINEDLEEGDDIFPVKYLDFMGENFRDMVEGHGYGENGIITDNDLTGDTYLPFLRVLAMTGERVKSVHLNDPDSNDVPGMSDYRRSEALQAAMGYMGDSDIYVVLEPEGEMAPGEASRRVDEVVEMLEESG
ncbi:MAG: hypothetical protein ABEJ91_01745 [Candidatus Nanohaloarchaea archaeon]